MSVWHVLFWLALPIAIASHALVVRRIVMISVLVLLIWPTSTTMTPTLVLTANFLWDFSPGLCWDSISSPNLPEITVLQMYSSFVLFSLVTSFVKVTQHQITAIFSATALNIYYWFNAPVIAGLFGDPALTWIYWQLRVLVFVLSLFWIYRTYIKEKEFFEQAAMADAPPRVGANDSLVSHRASLAQNPEVIIDSKRIVLEGQRTILTRDRRGE